MAFLDAVESAVSQAREHGLRLAVAVAGDGADELPLALESIAGRPVYAVGARASAVVLPGLGRAEALGVLASSRHAAVPGAPRSSSRATRRRPSS